MIRRRLALLALLAASGAGPARAQDAGALLSGGVRAYQDLEFDSAAVLLRGVLARTTPGSTDSTRTQALVYLGAVEFYRARRDSATAAFRQVLYAQPRFRPSQLIFPPEISSLFEEVRLGTRAVVVTAPPVSEIGGTADRFVARLHASSVHEITVAVVRGRSLVLRTLYAGAIGDSLEVLWDGRDTSGMVVDSGSAVLRVTSRGPGAPPRTVEVPLDIRRSGRELLPVPAPPTGAELRPEMTPGRASARTLLLALGTAGVSAALPSLVGNSADASGVRFGVAGAIGLAGIVAFRVAGRSRPIPENIAANQQLRRAWERQAEAARAENERRQGEVRLTIRSQPQRVGGSP